MNLRATHYGYAYQDLITGIALVDLSLGTAEAITVDTKGFPGDRFDDLNLRYHHGRRVRIQIKHTTEDRELSKATFSGDGRSLKLDKVLDSLLQDLAEAPGTTYRIVVRDGGPDDDLAEVLKPVDPAEDPGDPLPGVTSRRYRFDPKALRDGTPWTKLVKHLTDKQLQDACRQLVVDTSAPASSLSFAGPGPAERVLLRRCTEELGAGRPPNAGVSSEYVARALADAATGARATDGNVARESLLPEIGLITDFGAVIEGHPIETAVAVVRAGAAAEVRKHVDAVAPAGGSVVVTGEPGVGKSWLCEQLADTYREEDWIVARHHCWLGAGDLNREERVQAEVVIGSLLQQLDQIVPEATANLRPRFAATVEALAAAVQACRSTHDRRNVLLIVDGLDHVDRVLGRRTNQQMDPSRLLVDQLAAIDLPPGVCLLIASQPGPHLVDAAPAAVTGGPVRMPRMSWEEVHTLTTKHGLLDAPNDAEPLSEGDVRVIVDLVYNRSGGNALYATYLCRHATRVSPLEAEDAAAVTVPDIVHRLTQIPETANDVDAYYTHLLTGLTPDQEYAICTLALCDFSVSPVELGEILPAVEPLLKTALAKLAPVLTLQPGLGGLRIHHESFSRHILRGRDDDWVKSIREAAAAWLRARGFFTDARAFRHLPDLLAHLDQYDELKDLIQPGFVSEGIRAFQPPEALVRVVGVVARMSEARLDWPTLIACVETRKSIDTYEGESLTDSIVEYADVVVAVVGAGAIAERLMYEGRVTFPARWGLRICEAVDRAGAAAPWKAYLEAREFESKRERSTYSSDRDGTLHLALQRGLLRLRGQRREYPPGFTEEIAEHLQLDHDASLEDLVEVFTAGLPAGLMPEVAAAMTDQRKAAHVYLALADLAGGEPGLPEAAELALEAWSRDPALNIVGYLSHGIPPADVLAGLGISDFEEELRTATDAVVASGPVNHDNVKRWLSLVRLAHAIDRTSLLKYATQLTGAGFYRAWLRYAVATVGIADDVANGRTTPEAASTAVLVALGALAAEAHDPFVGDPNASRLLFIHPLIHDVIEKSLVVVQPTDLEPVLDRLIAMATEPPPQPTSGCLRTGRSSPTTFSKSCPASLTTSESVPSTRLVAVIRERRDDTNAGYGMIADFELATARICHAAGANDEADECWRRACLLLASYGGHKDPSLSELTDSIHDIAALDIDTARACLAKLVNLVYLVVQHTDGRSTSHFVNRWWEKAADVDPIAAGIDGADARLSHLGFEDGRAYTAHKGLLVDQVSTGDPVVLGALRLTVGMDWRQPATDLELLTRLHGEIGANLQVDAIVAIVANSVAASYDDQAMLYSSDQPTAVVTPELFDAVVRLGGPSFPARTPRREQKRRNSWDSDPRPDPLELQKRLANEQRPLLPDGRAGVVVAARDYELNKYRNDGAAPRWDLDALASAIGWRIIETTIHGGAEAGIELIDDVAREVSTFSDNEVFAAVGEGLAIRCDDTMPDPLKRVAAHCLTRAYIRIRGGGWRTFAGRERANLWATAHALDAATAEQALAEAIVGTVDTNAQSTYGVTQAVIAAFTATLPGTLGATAAECWEAAFRILDHRLPGVPQRREHTYRPTPTPDAPEVVDVAMATLAVATIAHPMRAELRQTLVATALLLTCRPTIGQAALAHVLGARIDAGRVAWLLDVVRACLRPGELSDELAAVLTRLAGSDWLSVRALAAVTLKVHGRPVPALPVTEPLPKVRAAFHDLMREHG